MITLSRNDPFSKISLEQPTVPQRRGAASPTSISDDPLLASEALVADKVGTAFIKAPQKFFGKFLEVNVAKRTTGEKEANQAVRAAFHKALHDFFGPILAEYLYPVEGHEKIFQEGAPLTPQQAQKIVNKGVEMMDVLAKYCELCLDGDAQQGSSQAGQLDQAMIRYVGKQEALPSKESGIMDILPHAARALGGGAMAAFAIATMGHLSPSDLFFSLDLLSSKKLSKGIEDFIKTRLVQHIEHHLESYLQERRELRQPLSAQEEVMLRDALRSKAESLNRESAYPTVKSEMIRAGNLSMEGVTDIHNPIEAINYIFFSPLEHISAGGAHSQLFRDGVTAVIENVKKIQEAVSKTETSAEELAKIKKAIEIAREGAGTWRDIEDQDAVKADFIPTKKKEKVFRAQLTRGI